MLRLMDWADIEFVREDEDATRRSRPFLDGWETVRFVIADEDVEEQEAPPGDAPL